jgi:hypothetical protein
MFVFIWLAKKVLNITVLLLSFLTRLKWIRILILKIRNAYILKKKKPRFKVKLGGMLLRVLS